MDTQLKDYQISTDKRLLNIPFIQQYLCYQSYWAAGITEETVRASIDGALCFGLFRGEQQIGFARVITDEATFAYLADVFIAEDFRGLGLSKWLMEVILNYPSLQGLRRWMLGTKDAHGLYEKFGFRALRLPERFMELHQADVYNKGKN